MGDWVVAARAALPLHVQVRLRPALGAVRDPVVRAVRHDRRVRQPLPAPRAGLSAGSSCCYALFLLGHGRRLAGRHDRDAVRRLGAGRAVVGAAGGVLPRAAGAGAQRPAGLDRSTASPTPRSWSPRSCCTTSPAAGDFDELMGAGPWPDGHGGAHVRTRRCSSGLLLLVAAAGKSALVPFSGWLPRAMEGPTPSSAVFYGALSVHLGAFLLLRVSPILELLDAAVRGGGRARAWSSALFAAIAGRVQTDIKSALAFASLTQVGIIVAEIGLGLALHRADSHHRPRLPADAAIPAGADAAARLSHAGERHRRPPAAERDRLAAARSRAAAAPGVYRLALERGYLDALLDRLRRAAVRARLPLVRRAGTPLDRLARRPTVARVRPARARRRRRRRAAHDRTAPALAGTGDPAAAASARCWVSRLRDPERGAAAQPARSAAWRWPAPSARGSTSARCTRSRPTTAGRSARSCFGVEPVRHRRAQRAAAAAGGAALLPHRPGDAADQGAAILVRAGRWSPRRSCWRRSAAAIRGAIVALLAAGRRAAAVWNCAARGKPTRVFVVHMALFVALLRAWAGCCVDRTASGRSRRRSWPSCC